MDMVIRFLSLGNLNMLMLSLTCCMISRVIHICVDDRKHRIIHSHLCTRGDATVALSNHPSSLSVGNTSPRVEVYSPSGEDAMSGGLLRPRAAARRGETWAINAHACVHDARANTTAVGASMTDTECRGGASLSCSTAAVFEICTHSAQHADHGQSAGHLAYVEFVDGIPPIQPGIRRAPLFPFLVLGFCNLRLHSTVACASLSQLCTRERRLFITRCSVPRQR